MKLITNIAMAAVVAVALAACGDDADTVDDPTTTMAPTETVQPTTETPQTDSPAATEVEDDDDGDSDDTEAATSGDATASVAGTTYTGVFFKTIEEQSSNTVVVGKGELTLADDGQVVGTMTAYPDSEDFPDDTLTLSGTYEEGAMQGNKQGYNVELELDLDDGPDYTATGQVYTVAEKLFTEKPMVLSADGAPVGKFILAEQDQG